MFAIGLLCFGVGMFGLGALAVWVLTFGTTVWLGTEEEPSQPLPAGMTAFMPDVVGHRHPTLSDLVASLPRTSGTIDNLPDYPPPPKPD